MWAFNVEIEVHPIATRSAWAVIDFKKWSDIWQTFTGTVGLLSVVMRDPTLELAVDEGQLRSWCT